MEPSKLTHPLRTLDSARKVVTKPSIQILYSFTSDHPQSHSLECYNLACLAAARPLIQQAIIFRDPIIITIDSSDRGDGKHELAPR